MPVILKPFASVVNAQADAQLVMTTVSIRADSRAKWVPSVIAIRGDTFKPEISAGHHTPNSPSAATRTAGTSSTRFGGSFLPTAQPSVILPETLISDSAMPNDQSHDPRVATAGERVAQAVGLSVAAVASSSEPTGAPSISSVTDNGDGTLTILGSNFGSKTQAAPVLVDYADHAYENGTLNDYHSTFTDGQNVGRFQDDPNELWYSSFLSDVYGADSNQMSRLSLRHSSAQGHYRCRGDDCGFGAPMANGGESPTTTSTKMYLAWWLRRKYTDRLFNLVLDDVSGTFQPDEAVEVNGYSGRFAGKFTDDAGVLIHEFEMPTRSRSDYGGFQIVGQTSGATATFPEEFWGGSNPPYTRYQKTLVGTKLTRLRDNSDSNHLRSSHSFTDFFVLTDGDPEGGAYPYERTYHSPPQAAGEWRFIEEMVDIDPETETGKHFVLVDGKNWTGDDPDFATFNAIGRDATKNIWPSWIGNNAHEYFQQSDLDEIYFDTTLQRVYLGNASTYDACTTLELQRPSQWSDTEVVANKHEGSLAGETTLWVYAAGPDGTINESGYEVQV